MPIFNMVGGKSTLTGDAAVGEVLASKTFYSNDPASKLTGTMPNNGEVDTDITAVAQQVTIAQGYHNGSGTVQIAAADQAKLIAGNIKSGVTVLGVAGSIVDLTVDDLVENGMVIVTKNASNLPLTVDHYGTFVSPHQYKGAGGAFGSVLTGVTFKNTITKVGYAAFDTCPQLQNITLPENIILDGFAFRGCSKIAFTSLPAGTTFVSVAQFWGCTLLALTALPITITALGDYAFADCTTLTVMTCQRVATVFGSVAANGSFKGCTNLNNVTIGSAGYPVTSIGVYAFTGCGASGTLTVYTANGNALANSPYGWTGTVVHTQS